MAVEVGFAVGDGVFDTPPPAVPFADPRDSVGQDCEAGLIACQARLVHDEWRRAYRGDPSIVFCGHAHTALATSVDGIAVRIAPGVVSTLRLPCEPHPDTLDRGAPPGLALHLLDEHSGALTTHVRMLAP